MLLLFGTAAYIDYRAERERAGQRQLNVARSMAATVERELHTATVSLQVLALSPRLQQADMAGFRALAMRYIATAPAGSTVMLLTEDGRQLVTTAADRASSPPANAGLVRRVFRTGQPIIGNLYQPPSGGLITTADVPVLLDGRVAYDLSLVLPASRFAAILAAEHLSAGTVAAVFDRNGVSVARVPSAGPVVGQPAAASLLPTLLGQDEGVLGSISREGQPTLTAFSRTQPSGWSVSLGVPEAELRAPLRRSISVALGLGALGMLASAAVAFHIGQRILGPLRALTRFAADPAHAGPGRMGLSELDAVAAALRHSLRERQAAMNALQALNDGLEARISQEIASRIEAQTQLAQAQRMEALGQLAGGIAHDFNNVLQAVTGGLSLIQRRAGDQEAVRRLATLAADAAARGAAITGRLLTFARRGELAAVPIEAQPLLEGLREMLAYTLGSDITVHVEASATLPRFCADKPQLETVLINLAINARDAMPEGGTLTLSAGLCSPAGSAWAEGAQAGARVRLVLTDTGAGMSPDVLARASEPFFTTKEPGQGTGLGLAMARGFAEQSGGGFAIASAPGLGTTVSLWFPQASAPERAPAILPIAAPGTRDDTPMRLLMVDDDDMVREVLAGEMEARGFLVTTAADAAAALVLIDGGQPADLLITDFAMAGMDGLALIAEARRRRPNLPALLLTGYAEGDAEVALSLAQDRQTLVLRKPIGGEDLAQRAAGLRRRR